MMLTTPAGTPASTAMSANAKDFQRILRCRLDDDRVAHGQRRGDLARHVDQREVVRGDAGDHAHGLTDSHCTDQAATGQRRGRHDLRRQAHGVGQQRFPGVPAEALDGDRQLHGRRDALGGAGLRLDQRDEFVAALLEQVRDAGQDFGALRSRRTRPLTQGRPCRSRGLLRLGHAGLGCLGDGLLGRRVDDGVAAGLRLHPGTVDEQFPACRDRGGCRGRLVRCHYVDLPSYRSSAVLARVLHANLTHRQVTPGRTDRGSNQQSADPWRSPIPTARLQ